jgi:citrate synthase
MATVESVVAQTLSLAPEKITDALTFGSVPEWDSLTHVNLMLALEAAFGVSIDEDAMVELTSLGAIRSFLAEKGKL